MTRSEKLWETYNFVKLDNTAEENPKSKCEQHNSDVCSLKGAYVGLHGQARKSAERMPWHQEPKKDVAIYEKLRGAESRRYIRRYPNGETRPGASPVNPY